MRRSLSIGFAAATGCLFVGVLLAQPDVHEAPRDKTILILRVLLSSGELTALRTASPRRSPATGARSFRKPGL